MSRMSELLMKRYLGQPIAILCARYWYRGVLIEADDDTITLSFPRCVEVTGPSTSPQPQTEDPMPSDLHISVGSIEMLCQPLWCWHEMPNTKAIRKGRRLSTLREENTKLAKENAAFKDEQARAKTALAEVEELRNSLKKKEREYNALKMAKGK